ncbi:hypothetical protein AY599_20575 [Leptolyngbya valderiana BDU 20041]|nr:hypothetical protein AY599_20575 [Leptolyngbya valderiana BDU 20041]
MILCGGGGTRLWPLSTTRRPKQFIALTGERSMLAETAARVSDPARFSAPLAIGSALHADLLRRSLPEAELLLEPEGRNSAPPIAAACLKAAPDDLLLVTPADHHIEDVGAFLRAVDVGAEAAKTGSIVTFGIVPNHPATGYGYIRAPGSGAPRPVERFVEKPDLGTAESYLDDGDYFWNAGIFLFRAGVMTQALGEHAPDILEAVRLSLGEDGLDRAAFSKVRSQSIDYAVLERAGNISVVPVAMGWSDLGDFRALHAIERQRTGRDSVVLGRGAATDADGVYIRSDIGPVAVHGVDDVAVVATPDGVLVTRLSDAANVKTASAQARDEAAYAASEEQRAQLGDWLWSNVLPSWARLCFDRKTAGFVECLASDGTVRPNQARRGRVAPRQLFSFARARRHGWNPDGLADAVIDAGLGFLNGPGRSPLGGWAHHFSADGEIADARRDFYDHTFIALAGAELASAGDCRGRALAEEAFSTIDDLFGDEANGGWGDTEVVKDAKLSNPHMHLLEASLAYYEATADERALRRIETISVLFERWMFDPASGAVREVFGSDWSRSDEGAVEPGHCYEWAFLLGEVHRLTGRDTASWSRRLIRFAEDHGTAHGLAQDVAGSHATFRLWPQLERLRALCAFPQAGHDPAALLKDILDHYVNRGPVHGWVDKIDSRLRPVSSYVPASMLYHIMTVLAPLAGAPAAAARPVESGAATRAQQAN